MADKKQNPLLGAFRDPPPASPPGAPAAGEKKPAEPVQTVMDLSAAGAAPTAKTPESPKAETIPKNAPEPPAKAGETPKPAKAAVPQEKAPEEKKPVDSPKDAPAAPADKAAEEKKPADLPKGTEAGKPGKDPKAADATPQGKAPESEKPTGEPKTAPAAKVDKPGAGEKTAAPPKEGETGKAAAPKEALAAGKPAAPKDAPAADKAVDGKKDQDPKKAPEQAEAAKDTAPAQPPEGKEVRFVPLSKIHDLPGTYVKDTPRKDYDDLIKSIKAEGLKEAVVLRQREDGEYQLVDGFHRIQAVKGAGMLEIKADVYDMTMKEATDYRRARHTDKPLPIPGKLVPPGEPAKADKAAAPAPEAKEGKDTEPEIPEDFKLPLTRQGQPEIITTLKVSEIHPFEGHPFHVKDDKDMMDLVDSIKKFGVLEPVVVIPRQAGGYEMVSGHRRRRACELAGIATMPVIVRQLDRDEAVISMVDANLKRENISPMEKARAYAMKLEAMQRKAGRRTKEEKAALEAAGKKPMRADEELAQQTGESRSNIQKLVRLTNLTPELQQMVEDKTLPVHTAADLSYLKKEEQAAVADAIQKEAKVPTGAQAVELKKASQQGELTKAKIEQTVAPTKREETPPLKITLGEEDLRPYFPDKRTTIPDVKRGVLEALDLRKKAIERQKAKAQADKGAKKKTEQEPSR